MWASPPNSPTIVGNAVATIVESRAAKSITSNSPPKTTSTLSSEVRDVRSAGAATCITIELRLFPLHRLCLLASAVKTSRPRSHCPESQQLQQLRRNQSVQD